MKPRLLPLLGLLLFIGLISLCFPIHATIGAPALANNAQAIISTPEPADNEDALNNSPGIENGQVSNALAAADIGQEITNTPEAADKEQAVNSPTENEHTANTPEARREFGQIESLTEQNEMFFSNLLYPSIGIENVDKYISAWADNIYINAKNSMTAPLVKTAFAAASEINTDFSTYLLGDRYVGIEITGYYKERAKKSKDIIKTFNISIDGKRILNNDEIISPKQNKHLVTLLSDEILKADPSLSHYTSIIDENWFNNIVLVHEGVKIILEKGKFLPISMGICEFTLKYDDLGDSFKLPRKYFSGKVPIDPSKPIVALTFDDGPAQFSEKILDILEEYGSKATFCVLGNRVDDFEQTIVRAASLDNEIIGHSWDHKQLTRLGNSSIRKQLEDTNNAIFNLTGKMPVFHRPPYGSVNNAVSAVSKELGMAMINWSVDTNDWKTRSADATYEHIMENVRNGSVILMHDIHASTSEAMERVIPKLIEEGYQLVTLSELFSLFAVEVVPGTLYKAIPE